MSVIDKLIEAGRDPLEALLGESAEEERERLDKAIVRELKDWSPAMLKRLREMVEQRAMQANQKCDRLQALLAESLDERTWGIYARRDYENRVKAELEGVRHGNR